MVARRLAIFDDRSRDGKTLLFDEIVPGMARGLWKWNAVERKASTIIDTIHSEGYGALSPDGKWLAYQSDETGINEVVVLAWERGSQGTKRLFTFSKGGGALPRTAASSSTSRSPAKSLP
jgi:Tol biopolymer transport system component